MDKIDLEIQIEQARKTVHVDSYPMSIGELVNLYKEGDLNIQPEFQRIFRWKERQKSQFIESILLGIPIPSIFVAQQHDGRWDVVDGLQRISTILQFLGFLRDENDKLIPPLELEATKYLPNLKGKVAIDKSIDHTDDKIYQTRLIHPNILRAFKREKIDLKIIKKESNEDAKLELFQRLNTGGSKLTDQEVRNCILLMVNRKAFEWLQDLAKNNDFNNTVTITKRKEEESYFNELILKYLVLRHFDENELKEEKDLNVYLDRATSRIFGNSDFDFDREKVIFERTFKLLNESLNEDAFRKYQQNVGKYKGPFSNPIYECLTFALSHYLADSGGDASNISNTIQEISRSLPTNNSFLDIEKPGTRSLYRLMEMRKLGLTLFSHE
ncbi:DUF262 domain-containing protein [Neisseria sp. Ec49-e6-T10]|uniref:DUF262 domain-containing protein n=1 Tax=Neisseria sp. Ec49-e6-T10 TaxID=3140744 RepID=UPI003EBDF6BD